MERAMDAIEVYCSEAGMVVIKQDSAMVQDTSFVAIHPDQIETVIRWLQEAKAELISRVLETPSPK